MMLKATFLLTIAALATASSSPGGPVQPLLARAAADDDEDVCGRGQKRCLWGCVKNEEQCCVDVNRDEPWSCPLNERCGGPPWFGCYGPDPSTSTAREPPMTVRPPAATVPHPGGPDFNPTFTISSAPKTTSTPDKNEKLGSNSAASSSLAESSIRQTCLFGEEAAAAVVAAAAEEKVTGSEMDFFGGCPPTLTSVTDQVSMARLIKADLFAVNMLMALLIVWNLVDF